MCKCKYACSHTLDTHLQAYMQMEGRGKMKWERKRNADRNKEMVSPNLV